MVVMVVVVVEVVGVLGVPEALGESLLSTYSRAGSIEDCPNCGGVGVVRKALLTEVLLAW